MMTRRHFYQLAEILSDAKKEIAEPHKGAANYAISVIEQRIVEMCFSENPLFDAQRFKEAAK